MPRTIRPDYDSPKPLAYINKVIGDYHRLPIELVRWDEGYHTLFYSQPHLGVYEEHNIPVPYTNALRLGEWVREAIGFAQAVRSQHNITGLED
jgi:hypothetical protein